MHRREGHGSQRSSRSSDVRGAGDHEAAWRGSRKAPRSAGVSNLTIIIRWVAVSPAGVIVVDTRSFRGLFVDDHVTDITGVLQALVGQRGGPDQLVRKGFASIAGAGRLNGGEVDRETSQHDLGALPILRGQNRQLDARRRQPVEGFRDSQIELRAVQRRGRSLPEDGLATPGHVGQPERRHDLGERSPDLLEVGIEWDGYADPRAHRSPGFLHISPRVKNYAVDV